MSTPNAAFILYTFAPSVPENHGNPATDVERLCVVLGLTALELEELMEMEATK